MRRKTRVHDDDGKSISRLNMAWLGSTIKSLDTRKEIVNYIGGNTQPSRAVVTNSGGEIDSSVVTVAELALLSACQSNVQTQLADLGNDKEDR